VSVNNRRKMKKIDAYVLEWHWSWGGH